jgi:hypothetical protein
MKSTHALAAWVRHPVALAAMTLMAAACGNDTPTAASRGGVATAITLSMPGGGSLASLGDTARITAQVEDVDGRPLGDAPLQWTVTTPGIVEQVGPGQFRALRNGRTVVVATIDPGLTGVKPTGYHADRVVDSVAIEVRQQPAQIIGAIDALFRTIGTRRALQLQVLDARGTPVDPAVLPRIMLTTGNANVATVDSTGRVRSVGDGTTTISVSAGSATWQQQIEVQARRPHVSCMTYTTRRRTAGACVNNQFVIYEARSVQP